MNVVILQPSYIPWRGYFDQIRRADLFIFYNDLQASHIVGGEFELQYTGRGLFYNVRMKMYFDDINANAGLLDSETMVKAIIFEKGTNKNVKVVDLVRLNANLISYWRQSLIYLSWNFEKNLTLSSLNIVKLNFN